MEEKYIKNIQICLREMEAIDFTTLRDVLGKEYIHYMMYYEKLMKEEAWTVTEMEFVVRMNLLAASKDAKDLKHVIERWFLLRYMKDMYKKII